ncbi:phage tail sheath protein [Salinisphaera sp. USBA-960]|nr:phage tail sheath protein [Salifodinibacter halophilus]NNC25296.1 phage tail sheath protein [Salifodinibacter halophilus]
MPQDFHHGVRVVEINDGIRPIRTISTAIIGLVATAADADADAFPLDTPTLVTNVDDAKGGAGTSGTLKPALNAIADQANPVVVVVRVEEGATDSDTDANVIGTTTSENKKTGLQALLSAKQKLGVTPRILGCPDLDTEPVAQELITLAQTLRAFAYVYCDGATTVSDAITYAESFGARELMPVWPQFEGFDVDAAATVTLPAVARVLGLRAKLDETVGWHKTISNIPVNGVTGISRDVYWDLQSTGTDADLLNDANITTLINQNGYRFWGSRTTDPSGYFPFENYTRTAQIIADTIAEAQFAVVDKPMTPALAKDLIEGVNAKLRQMTRLGYLLGGSAWFDDALNPKDVLKKGKLYISYDYTPVPPLENLVFQQHITDTYLADFATRVAAA